MSAITTAQFFSSWKASCEETKQELLAKWERPSDYTSTVLYAPDSVTGRLAQKLELSFHRDYYSLDAVFFKESDRVYCAPIGQTWVQNVDVAFEHENFFRSGLFQEASHLLITRARLRVLVTYPEMYDVQPELDRLAKIIAASGLIDPAFLFITGKRTDDKQDIMWHGHTFSNGQLTLSYQ